MTNLKTKNLLRFTALLLLLTTACDETGTPTNIPVAIPSVAPVAQATPFPGTPTRPDNPTQVPQVVPARIGASTAYHAGLKAVLLFGGMTGNNTGKRNDLWAWNGLRWLAVTISGPGPTPRDNASLSYDAAHNQLLLFGGVDQAGRVLGDTWLWDSKNWIEQHPTTAPSARAGAAIAYHTRRNQIMLFGGNEQPGKQPVKALADFWWWDGQNWQEIELKTAIPARTHAGMAYDALHQQLVLFGGEEPSRNNSTTWTWNDPAWTLYQSSQEPYPYSDKGATLVYDEAHQQIVLCDAGTISDTWLWDGKNWNRSSNPTRMSANHPPSDCANGAAYDAIHQMLVATINYRPGEPYDWQAQTWTWDGKIWRQLGWRF